jgi:hypothetical protein
MAEGYSKTPATIDAVRDRGLARPWARWSATTGVERLTAETSPSTAPGENERDRAGSLDDNGRMTRGDRWLARLGRWVVLGSALGLGGCAAHLQLVTSGHIPCSPGDIAISNDRADPPRRKWDARCVPTGADYQCSALGNQFGTIIKCYAAGTAPEEAR